MSIIPACPQTAAFIQQENPVNANASASRSSPAYSSGLKVMLIAGAIATVGAALFMINSRYLLAGLIGVTGSSGNSNVTARITNPDLMKNPCAIYNDTHVLFSGTEDEVSNLGLSVFVSQQEKPIRLSCNLKTIDKIRQFPSAAINFGETFRFKKYVSIIERIQYEKIRGNKSSIEELAREDHAVPAEKVARELGFGLCFNWTQEVIISTPRVTPRAAEHP